MAKTEAAAAYYPMKRYALQVDWAGRAAHSGIATATLIASGRGMETLDELLQMQKAVARQWQQLGFDWVQGVAAWGRELANLRAANTMSKIAEQEFNLVGQFGQLVSDQVTAVVTLMESVQVAYNYWVSEKLAA